jgi:sortase A
LTSAEAFAGAGSARPDAVAARGRRGSILRALGILCLVLLFALGGFVAFELWGTGVSTARAQRALRITFQQDLATGPTAIPVPTKLPVLHLAEGAPAMIIRIPRMHLDMVVVEGTLPDDLAKGPGHYRGTAFPWQPHGRVAIAGHRTTHLHPFWSLDHLRRGDVIEAVTRFGAYRYRVTGTRTVLPTDSWILNQTGPPSLVLTTCSPRFSASHRLVVFASRVRSANDVARDEPAVGGDTTLTLR